MTELFSYENLARQKSTNPQFERLGRQLDIIKANAPEGTHMAIWTEICTKVFGAKAVNDFILFINSEQDLS